MAATPVEYAADPDKYPEFHGRADVEQIGDDAASDPLRSARNRMQANHYELTTHWRLRASLEEVSEVLGDALSLPRWWPTVYLSAEPVASGLPNNHAGGVIAVRTRGWLPYTLSWRLRLTENDAPNGFSFDAEGDFVGRGVWEIYCRRSLRRRPLRLAGQRRETFFALVFVYFAPDLRAQPPLGHGARRRKPEPRTDTSPRVQAEAALIATESFDNRVRCAAEPPLDR